MQICIPELGSSPVYMMDRMPKSSQELQDARTLHPILEPCMMGRLPKSSQELQDVKGEPSNPIPEHVSTPVCIMGANNKQNFFYANRQPTNTTSARKDFAYLHTVAHLHIRRLPKPTMNVIRIAAFSHQGYYSLRENRLLIVVKLLSHFILVT